MANSMVRPITLDVIAFDATQAHTFEFIVNGGNQVVKNEILIKKNEDESVVYNNVTETYQFNQVVPKNTLQNGVSYLVSFRTYDINNNVSEYSVAIPFYCYTKPTLIFNINDGDIINNSYFTFECTYNQAQGELMDYMYFNIYNASNRIISRSEDIYNSNNPPFICEYTYNGFEDNELYKVSVVCVTINGTIVESNIISFTTHYNFPIIKTIFNVENKCNDGYIKVDSEVISIEGLYRPSKETPIFIEDDKAIDLVSCSNQISKTLYNRSLTWRNNFVINKSQFLIRCWFTPSQYNNDIKSDNKLMEFYYTDSSSISVLQVYMCRNGTVDYIILRSKDGKIYNYSNSTKFDPYGQYFLWIKNNNNQWEIIVERLDTTPTAIPTFEWNGDSNIIYNMTTNNIVFENETIDKYTLKSKVLNNPKYNINNIKISNGIYRHFNVSSNVNLDYTNVIPTDWDSYTILDCNFDNDTNGGNINTISKMVSGFEIRRKDENTLNWVTIAKGDFNDSKYKMTLLDSCVPNAIRQDYALVPLMKDGTEGEYTVKSIMPKWNGVFISNNKGTIFKLYNAVKYSNTNRNAPNGILSPIGRKYPIVIDNSDINYQQGGMSAELYGYDFEDTRIIDRKNVVKQVNEFIDFLTNKEAKVITDWNGNIFIVKIINNPSISYLSNMTNGAVTVNFEWIEQGKYNNYMDLYNNNLINIL